MNEQKRSLDVIVQPVYSVVKFPNVLPPSNWNPNVEDSVELKLCDSDIDGLRGISLNIGF
jgi:hypothetical protein